MGAKKASTNRLPGRSEGSAAGSGLERIGVSC
jgi:hypothetical protein